MHPKCTASTEGREQYEKEYLFLSSLSTYTFQRQIQAKRKGLKPEMSALRCYKREEKFEALENVKVTNLHLYSCSGLYTPVFLKEDPSSLLRQHQAQPGLPLACDM